MLADCPLTHLDAPRMRRNDFYDALTRIQRHCFRILCRVRRRAGHPFGLRPLWALALGLMERGVAKQATLFIKSNTQRRQSRSSLQLKWALTETLEWRCHATRLGGVWTGTLLGLGKHTLRFLRGAQISGLCQMWVTAMSAQAPLNEWQPGGMRGKKKETLESPQTNYTQTTMGQLEESLGPYHCHGYSYVFAHGSHDGNCTVCFCAWGLLISHVLWRSPFNSTLLLPVMLCVPSLCFSFTLLSELVFPQGVQGQVVPDPARRLIYSFNWLGKSFVITALVPWTKSVWENAAHKPRAERKEWREKKGIKATALWKTEFTRSPYRSVGIH